MREEEKNSNPIYIASDLVEDIIVRLPLKQIFRFKTVSKQWRSIVESKSFAEMRKRRSLVEKAPKILAVGNSVVEGDEEEIEIVYLERDEEGTTMRPSLTCDGLVCIPVPGWINVLNPLTGDFLRFPSGPSEDHNLEAIVSKPWWDIFPGHWLMGFGKDKVKGTYKIVRMLFDLNRFEILDIDNYPKGGWRELNRHPPYKIDVGKKSACVNGSIYWLKLLQHYKILAFDLHTEEFHDVHALPPLLYSTTAQIVNLENRLAIADVTLSPEWRLNIWIMDSQEQCWSMTYCISLSRRVISSKFWARWFTPLAVSKQGSLYLYDSEKRLFRYYPETDVLCCLSTDIFVMTSFVENLVPLGLFAPKITTSGYQYGLSYLQLRPKISSPSISGRMESHIPNILVMSSTLVLLSLIIFGYRFKYST